MTETGPDRPKVPAVTVIPAKPLRIRYGVWIVLAYAVVIGWVVAWWPGGRGCSRCSPMVGAVWGVLVLALVVGAFLLVRLSRATIAIDRDRIAVKYGSLSASIVQCSAVASGQAGARWVRLRNHRGRQLIWVPLRPRRDEVLAALRWHGWPVS